MQVVTQNTTDAAGLVQPLQVIHDQRDSNGNLIMTLREIGLDDAVRYCRRGEEKPMFNQTDVVMAVTGLCLNSAGFF
jgi:hypothetical protein